MPNSGIPYLCYFFQNFYFGEKINISLHERLSIFKCEKRVNFSYSMKFLAWRKFFLQIDAWFFIKIKHIFFMAYRIQKSIYTTPYSFNT